MLKIGLSSRAFRLLSAEEILPLAKEADASFIQWDACHVEGDLSRAEWLGNRTRELGMTVSSYGSTYVLGTDGDASSMLDVASALGANAVTVYLPTLPIDRTCEAMLVAEAGQLLSLAEAKGLSVVLASRSGSMSDDCERLLAFLKRVRSTRLSLAFAPYTTQTREGALQAYQMLLPYVSAVCPAIESKDHRLSSEKGGTLWYELSILAREAESDLSFLLTAVPLECLTAEVAALRRSYEAAALKDEFPDLLYDASVYAVEDRYQIIFHTKRKGAAYVRIGDTVYYDEDSGCVLTEKTVHSICVPMALLDRARCYTIGFFHVSKRMAYAFEEEARQTKTYHFRPVPSEGDIRIVMLGDAHGACELPARMASTCEPVHLLVLGGDIPNLCEEETHLLHIPYLASLVTHGEIPVVNVRGNHDTRGAAAPLYSRHVGTDNGRYYYTFRLGSLFAILLDCGEDKPDDHWEYGGLADYEQYRRSQIAFLDRILSDGVYEDYSHVAVFVHADPRTHFDRTVCAEWLARISAIRPDVMVCAHKHVCEFLPPCEEARDGYPPITVPTVIGSAPRGVKGTTDAEKPPSFTGTLLVFGEGGTDAYFIDDHGNEKGYAHFEPRPIGGELF